MKRNKITTAAALLILASGVAISTTASAAPLETKEYKSNGIVKFIPDDAVKPPVDPNNPDPANPVGPWDPSTPDHKPETGTAGPLSLDFASSIDFGVNKISNKDEIYYAEPQYLFDTGGGKDLASARPNYVQVTDSRGTNEGWTLKVKQEAQFATKDVKAVYKTLEGAKIKFEKGVADSKMTATVKPVTFALELIPGTAYKVMNAKAGSGAGTWVSRFGTVEDVVIGTETVKKNKAITLSIPGTSGKDAVLYETKLTWTLTNEPGTDAP